MDIVCGLLCVEQVVFYGMFHVEHFRGFVVPGACQVILLETVCFQSPAITDNYGVLCIGLRRNFSDNRCVIFLFMMPQEKTISAREQRRLRDARFAKLLEDTKPENQLKAAMVAARASAVLTQKELGRRMGTKQPAIARLENGRSEPSIATLRKLAAVTNSYLVLRLDGPPGS